MQRIHVSPAMGRRRIDAVTRQDVERLGRAMLARGLAPKTVRNAMTFLHPVFALALSNEWIERNPWLQLRGPSDAASGRGQRHS
jgi:site-specific recombinase XerD